MSVLIKTMTNLPEYCYDCPCYNGESSYCQADKKHRYSVDRPFWCPLSEIHPNATFMEKKFNIDVENEALFEECKAEEHRQLAEWLKELKQLREQNMKTESEENKC